jgi:acetyl-CoA carboxylase carboxyltransferase component
MSQDDDYGLRELARRQAAGLAMGGAEKVARQHEKGRLSVRERIALLLDPGSFDEQGLLTHSDRPEVQAMTPADGKVTGYGTIGGRNVFVAADDATVMAGSGGRVGMAKTFAAKHYATEHGIPIINLGDAGGARMPDIMGSEGLMKLAWPIDTPPRNRRVPMISAIMGDCFGLPSWSAAVSDLVVQVKGSVYAVGGSSIITVATGESVSDQELGGWELHANVTGAVDLFAEDDPHCMALIRQALDYLPSSCEQAPAPRRCHDDPMARIEGALDVVPSNLRQPYDMHGLIELIADQDSVLELKAAFDGSLITALTRIDGHVTGIVANNPMVTAGAMGPGACEKATSFICLCDSFHIPLLFLHDTPGFLLSRAAEEQKMPIQIMRLIDALHHGSVPRVSVIVRKSYGMAHFTMSGGQMLNDQLLCWPSADISFMAPEVAVNVMYGRRANGTSREAELERQAQLEALHRGSSPWGAAGLGLIDKVIDPSDTRSAVIQAFRRARNPDGSARRSKRLMANWPKIC